MKKNPHVLTLVDKYRYRKGISVTDEKSKTYITLKIIYIISFLWTVILNCMFIISSFVSMKFSEASVKTTPAVTISISTVILIIGFVFILKRIYLPGGVLSILSAVMGTVQFYTLLLSDIQLEGGIKHFFFWRHLGPALVLLVACIAVCYIGIRAKALLNRDYKKMLEKIYIKNSEKSSNISDDEWQKLMESGELFEEE